MYHYSQPSGQNPPGKRWKEGPTLGGEEMETKTLEMEIKIKGGCDVGCLIDRFHPATTTPSSRSSRLHAADAFGSHGE